ncbi:MAG: hypothetical protein J3R72DRAFT_440113 [Linnemannia gamsii]|nr:MAG: hypothetical protein J3R72DRAFT_440113 [Linnemannia gamsii]
MLAPSDTPTNSTTPGSSSDALMPSRSPSRAPQDVNYHLDDHSRASELQAASPQYVDDGYSVPSVHSVGSPYSRTPSVRHPHVDPLENSPSVSHPQAYSPSINNNNANSYYSPTLVSPALNSKYVPPPSPTPSHHSQAYPVPHTYNNNPYPTADSTNQQQQYIYQQDPYQQGYHQQPYPEPTLHSYPEPPLVDLIDEKVDQTSSSSVTKPVNNGRRKKIIWIGSIVILILIGAIVGLVIVMKNKDSGSNDNIGNNLGNNTARTSSALRPTSSVTHTSIPVETPTSSIPVTVPTSSIPVIVPTPQPSSGSGGGGGGRASAPPLPSPMPEKNKCPSFFCHNYYFETCKGACKKDSVYQTCKNECNGVFFCEMDCEKGECFDECSKNLRTCDGVCSAR